MSATANVFERLEKYHLFMIENSVTVLSRAMFESVMLDILTFKAPITTAADDKF